MLVFFRLHNCNFNAITRSLEKLQFLTTSKGGMSLTNADFALMLLLFINSQDGVSMRMLFLKFATPVLSDPLHTTFRYWGNFPLPAIHMSKPE